MIYNCSNDVVYLLMLDWGRNMELKKTALYEKHLELNAKMVEFAGYIMPIEYDSITVEHIAVREKSGLFDVSHMGEVLVDGNEAIEFLQYILTNDISKLENNSTMYSFMLNKDGGIVDDLLVYKYSDNRYMLVVNASNLEKDLKWINKMANEFDVRVKDISPKIAMIALQGKTAMQLLQSISSYDLNSISKFGFVENVEIAGSYAMVSRTGYTGEDGFEIYTDKSSIVKLWDIILSKKDEFGVVPAGLGCRDTLRFQAGLPLYGNELDEDTTPLEAGLGMFVKLDAKDFIGKAALIEQKNNGIKRKNIGFELQASGIPRHSYEVYKDTKLIGKVTTGYYLPDTKKSVGMALIDIDEAKLDNEILIKIRKSFKPAKIVKKKFFV